jgi:hypothetical protein
VTNLNYAKQIAAYLRSDPATDPEGNAVPSPPLLGTYNAIDDIYEGIAQGGIYTKPLKLPDPLDNRGATPTAFSASSGRIRPAIVVRLVSIPNHFQYRAIPKAVVPSVAVWFYGASHDTGTETMEEMRRRVELLLTNYIFETDQGPWAHVEHDFTWGIKENHAEFDGSMVDFARYAIITRSG